MKPFLSLEEKPIKPPTDAPLDQQGQNLWSGLRTSMKGDWWRLITSMFIHGGFMYLFLNIAGLAIAAIFVESILGKTKYFSKWRYYGNSFIRH